MLKFGTITRKRLTTEAIAGITTFFTMAYIVVVNPSILATQGTGMSFAGVMTATVLLSFAMTLFMGLYADLPFAVAPGMGINAFFAFSVILGKQVPWPIALGMIFWAGVLFVAVSVTPVRVAIARAIPPNLRAATATGIGIFLAFIGLKNAGLVVADPVTFVKLGHFDAKIGLSLLALLVMVGMLTRKSPFAFLLGILVATVAAIALGLESVPEKWVAMPDFDSVFLKLDMMGALRLAFVPTIISILFTDLFDSISTFIGVAQSSDMLDKDGEPKNLKEGLIVDAFATLGAGLAGTSSGTAFIESTAGIEMGGRTGLTAVFTALCFLPCFFLAPIVGVVPAYATAPVLILVGAFMFRAVGHIDFVKLENAVPAFLTMILIPLTFSITQGILWGFVAHVLLYCLVGRRKEVPWMLYGLAILSAGLVYLDHS